MEESFWKKEIGNSLALFILIFCAVFAGVTIIDASKKINRGNFLFLNFRESGLERCVKVEEDDSISIAKLNISAPLVFPDESEAPGFAQSLKQGVVHYPGSSLPGEDGETIFLGHSAPLGWPKLNYDWVFSDLNQLEKGDEIWLSYNGCRYSYKVIGKYFLEKGENLPEDLAASNRNILVLISCWPPGKNLRRIAVVSSLTPF